MTQIDIFQSAYGREAKKFGQCLKILFFIWQVSLTKKEVLDIIVQQATKYNEGTGKAPA